MPDSPAYGWTFLVARGRRLGYQPLLVPDFLAESNEYGVLDQASGGGPSTEPAVARVHGLAAGDVVVAYRTQRLSGADLEGSAGGPLTDEFGRPLELLYGFVVRAAGISALDDADFSVARAEAIRSYQRFLNDESGFELETSKPFALRSVPAAPEPVPSTVAGPPADAVPARAAAAAAERAPVAAVPSPVARRNLVLVALLVVALSASVWFLLLRGGGGPVTDVEISKLGSSTVDCGSSIKVQATVTTDAKATVTYHWESTRGTDSEPVAVEFEAAAAKTVETTVQIEGSSGEQLTFTQTLVVDEPNSADASREFTLTCR